MTDTTFPMTGDADAWIAQLETAIDDPTSALHGRDEILKAAKEQVATLAGEHGAGPLTEAQVDAMYDRHQTVLDALDPENANGLFYGRPMAAERARQKADEELELRLRLGGAEPRAPLTMEQKLERRIDAEEGVPGAIERFNNFIVPQIDAAISAFQHGSGYTWSDGIPLSADERIEYEALPESARTGRWGFVKQLPVSQARINDAVAAIKARIGDAAYAQAVKDAEYLSRVAGLPLPPHYEAVEVALVNYAAQGRYFRHIDDRRELARLPRRAAR